MSPVINVLLTLNLSSDYLEDYLNRFYDHHKAIVTYAFHRDQKLLQEIRDQNESAKRKKYRKPEKNKIFSLPNTTDSARGCIASGI